MIIMENLLIMGIDTRPMVNSALKLDYKTFSISYFKTVDFKMPNYEKHVLDQESVISCGRFEDNYSPDKLLDLFEETIIEKPMPFDGNNIIENERETKYIRESAEIEEKCSPYWASFACPFVFMVCWFFYLYSDRPDLGVIILSLFVGLPISFLISRFLYNSIKKSRIEKWKMEHPNDPRNKFLHFYKDV